MMEENSEGFGMKVIAVMVQRYGVLPRELWDLNSISDMGAGRAITYVDGYHGGLSKTMFERITGNDRYNIVNLTIDKDVSHKVVLTKTLRQLKIMSNSYNYPLDDLPASLEELDFNWECEYNQPLALPAGLRKLVLGNRYDPLIILPSTLAELQLGRDYSQPLTLPSSLKRLTFHPQSVFNLPVALPPTLTSIQLGYSYNHPIVLPPAIEEIRVGQAYTHDLSLPNTLRKIEWCCNRPIQIPEAVSEIRFGNDFGQPVLLPASSKKIMFAGSSYAHPLVFPDNVEELTWCPKDCDALVLPPRLQKLTWASDRSITLPSGLKELVLRGDVPLVFPESLLKVDFRFLGAHHHLHNLPESVQEVTWMDISHTETGMFTHPSTLEHLVLEFSQSELDFSHLKVRKMTIGNWVIKIKQWPQGFKELAFEIDAAAMSYPLRVPKGCIVVGELPLRVTME